MNVSGDSFAHLRYLLGSNCTVNRDLVKAAARHGADEVRRRDDPNYAAVPQHWHSIHISFGEERKRSRNRRFNHCAGPDDAHDVTCVWRVSPAFVDQTLHRDRKIPIEAKCVFAGSADQVDLENDAEIEAFRPDYGERGEFMAPEQIGDLGQWRLR